MELSRLARLLRARWMVILFGAIAVSAAAFYATGWWNQRIEPSHRATAALTYLGSPIVSRGGGTVGDTHLQSMLSLALQANAENLASNSESSITTDEATSQLLFTATGTSSETAHQLATNMRRAFNEADPTSEEPLIQARLAEILIELENFEAETGTSVPETDSIDPEDAVLNAQINALRNLLGQMAAELALLGESPETAETQTQLEAEMERIGNRIAELEASLSTSVLPEIDREQELQASALEVYASELIAEYQTLFLRLIGRNPTTRDDAVTVDDLTPSARPRDLMAGLGGLAGGLLTIAGLIMIDQARRPVWTRSDLDPIWAARVELPPRRPRKKSVEPWYPYARPGPRKRGVQTLRALIDGTITGDSLSVGIVGLKAGPEQVASLTADLGAALAASGRTILIIDAVLEQGSSVRNPGYNGTTLAHVLAHRAEDDEELLSFIKRSLGDQEEVLPSLKVLPAGRIEGDIVDALSRKHFLMLLREARSAFDVVLVSTPPYGHPTTDGLSQRLDSVLIVTKGGKAKASVLKAADQDLRARNSTLLGVALLTGRAAGSRTGRRDREGARKSAHRSNGSARHLPPSTGSMSRKERRRGHTPEQSVRSRPTEYGLGHALSRRVAKTVFAFVDLFHEVIPGPRLLIYHQVGSKLRREMNVTAKNFRRQLDWIQSHGEVVSLNDALDRVLEKGSRRLFVLTFDDGYRDMYENAFPLLLERRLPFTLYLSTNSVESENPLAQGRGAEPLTWEQIGEMHSSGLMTIGAHTHRHVDLRTTSPLAIAQEFELSDTLISERLGVQVKHFAYPWGYWSESAEPLVQERYATAVLGGGAPVVGSTDPHRIHRMPIQRSDGMFFFRRKVKRGMRMEEWLRRRARGYKGIPKSAKTFLSVDAGTN